MLKALAQIENEDSIKFLDVTSYLLSSKANKDSLLHSIAQIKSGRRGKTIKPSEMWK